MKYQHVCILRSKASPDVTVHGQMSSVHAQANICYAWKTYPDTRY